MTELEQRGQTGVTVHMRQAGDHTRAGDLEAAIAAYDRAIAIDPSHSDAWYNRGNAALRLGRLDLATASFQQAITLTPQFINPHINYGVALRKQGNASAAITRFDAALALNPDSAAAYYNRGNAFLDLNQPAAAIANFDAALRINPTHSLALFNRGNARKDLGDFEAAIADYDANLAIKPLHVEAHANRGTALLAAGRSSEALESYDRALEISPLLEAAHLNRSILLLSNGDLAEGFREHEWRYGRTYWPAKRWRGETGIAGKSILIYCEDGLGDTIQFCRYLHDLMDAGARVFFSPQRSLRALMGRLSSEIEIVEADLDRDDIPYDFHCPLLSLPFAFRTTLDTMPVRPSYLHADRERLDRWRGVIGETGFKIAICWQGSTNAYDIGRSFAVTEFAGISKIPNLRLLSVHRGAGEAQLEDLPHGMRIETFDGELDPGPDAFLDTAAVLQACDLVITSDTSVAHLAGALGVETWVVLKDNPAWRWLRDRRDSPWYPNMRLFRQSVAGDWRQPFLEMEIELLARLAAR